jgi:hypothetical protein
MKERKAFQFYKSYYEVVKELPNDKERINFLMALLEKQFEDIEPELKGLAKFAYISQKHSIESQVSGYKNKVGYVTPTQPPTQPPYTPPSVQEKEEEKEEEKEKEKEEEKLETETRIVMQKLNL